MDQKSPGTTALTILEFVILAAIVLFAVLLVWPSEGPWRLLTGYRE